MVPLPLASGCHGKSKGWPEGWPSDLLWHPSAGVRGNTLLFHFQWTVCTMKNGQLTVKGQINAPWRMAGRLVDELIGQQRNESSTRINLPPWSTVQCNTVQCSKVQYNTVYGLWNLYSVCKPVLWVTILFCMAHISNPIYCLYGELAAWNIFQYLTWGCTLH